MWGADVEALADLGRRLRAKGDQLENAASQLTQQAGAVGWEGSDAAQFHQVWNGEHRRPRGPGAVAGPGRRLSSGGTRPHSSSAGGGHWSR